VKRILAIDTSTDMSTLALVDGDQVIGSAEHTDARGHVEAIGTLFTQIPELDRSNSEFRIPDLIVCGVGPGPFTGLRVGIAFGETLAFAWGIPVVGICSLDAVAHGIVRTEKLSGDFVAAIPARRGEYYWASYTQFGQRISGPHVNSTVQVESNPLPIKTGFFPWGVDLAHCVGVAQELAVTPLYLRPPDAQPQAPNLGVNVGMGPHEQ
jgi:tRNA threonylcarbamoyladenosine biosynthesis protein TsaB